MGWTQTVPVALTTALAAMLAFLLLPRFPRLPPSLQLHRQEAIEDRGAGEVMTTLGHQRRRPAMGTPPPYRTSSRITGDSVSAVGRLDGASTALRCFLLPYRSCLPGKGTMPVSAGPAIEVREANAVYATVTPADYWRVRVATLCLKGSCQCSMKSSSIVLPSALSVPSMSKSPTPGFEPVPDTLVPDCV